MKRTTIFQAVLALALCLPSALAQAQATRTWVSGVGDDSSADCSRVAPCKTFAGAISKTATFGEINCLDPGGFGALTITKSIAIKCQVEAGVLVSGTNGIVINVAATDTVYLEGLDIEGLTTGLSGILILGGGTVHVKNCVIRLFDSSAAGFGINFTPNAAASLNVVDSYISDNGTGLIGGAMSIKPSAGSATVTIARTWVVNNKGNNTILADASSAAVQVQIKDSVIANNNTGLYAIYGATASLSNTLVTGNQYGVAAGAGGGAVILDRTTIQGSTVQAVFTNGGGVVFSYGNNPINDNASLGVTPTVIGLH
jgi:Right handed beta helix region